MDIKEVQEITKAAAHSAVLCRWVEKIILKWKPIF